MSAGRKRLCIRGTWPRLCVAVAVSLVGDGLVASVGEDDVVGAGSFSIAIAWLRVAHVNVAVAVLNFIGEVVGQSIIIVIYRISGKIRLRRFVY